jgi:hypothetical protein
MASPDSTRTVDTNAVTETVSPTDRRHQPATPTSWSGDANVFPEMANVTSPENQLMASTDTAARHQDAIASSSRLPPRPVPKRILCSFCHERHHAPRYVSCMTCPGKYSEISHRGRYR